jgi:hypothetical protein
VHNAPTRQVQRALAPFGCFAIVIRKPACRGNKEFGHNLGRAVRSFHLMTYYGAGAQSAKGFPNDVTGISGCTDRQLDKSKGFLAAMQALEFVLHSVARALDAFSS